MSDIFKQDSQGRLIGYHVECISDCKEDARPLLSLDTLRDDKPLFLSARKTDWFPFHLKDTDNFRILKVVFRLPSLSVTFNSEKGYHQLFSMLRDKDNFDKYHFTLTPFGKTYIDKGYHLISLHTDHELQESFLWTPGEYVEEIEEVDVNRTPLQIPGLPDIVDVVYHEEKV